MTHNLRTRWDSLPKNQIERLQMRQLRRYLRSCAVPFTAFYRNAFAEAGIDIASLRSYADLRQIPFTSKADLLPEHDNPKKSRDFIIIPDPQTLARRPSTIARALLRGKSALTKAFAREFRPIFMTSTTGRSADPVPFLYSSHDIDNMILTGRRIMEIGKSEPDFRHLNAFPFAPHLAFWFAHYAGTGFETFCLSTGGGKVLGTDGNVRLIQKICPDVLMGMPTFVYHLLNEAVSRGVQLHNLRTIVLGGEKVPAGMRRKLRHLANSLGSAETAILATYAFTEAKTAWIECRPHHPEDPPTGYHLYPDVGIVEIIDPSTGEPVPEGHPGEIVYTPLDARGSIVLRYRTGDHISGGISFDPCPVCGRSVPRLLGRISRGSEIKEMNLDKIKGTLVDFNQLEHALDDFADLGAWQIELRKANDDPLERDIIVLHVESESGNAPSSKALSDHLFAAAEIRPNQVQFHSRADMGDRLGIGRLLKEEKIADRRPAESNGSTRAADPDQKTQKIRRADPQLAANPSH